MAVRTGLQLLIGERLDLVRGRRVGLVSHPAAVLPDLTGAVDALLGAGVRLVALFGPEHGFDAAAADGVGVDHSVDRRTGLPVYSLYGATREPTPEMLEGIDILVFDMQDIGARFYTLTSTLVYVLRAAARAGLPVIVLDRPNPINGRSVEGPLVEPGFESFVGMLPVPIRHGLTIGEIARYAAGRLEPGCDLTVLPMTGWERRRWFDQTGLPWVPTSPAMPHLSTATVYPGTCLIEGTNLSEGRGTALPFEMVGAPWLDGYRLASDLNARDLPGVRFRPVRFMPAAGKHAGTVCEGVQVHVLDRDAMRPLLVGLHLIAACRAQAPQSFCFLPPWRQGTPCHFDLLAGSSRLREGLEAGIRPEELVAAWAPHAAQFERERAAWLMYA
jgi:uncharacterized protein YbbC (DUF1343 family)